MFRARKASPVDLLKAQIKRIEALNPKVNCITYEHFDQAMKEAQQSEDRYRRGDARPLEGITVAIKDEFSRPGWRTTQGSLIFKDSPPATENAAIIDLLEAAGAVMPFQTTVPEFYLFLGASTRAWGTTHNPWNLEYSPGGSSAGSAAALAAGFATLAMGSDMGGSIRIPASQNGLYGFRPPFGRVAGGEIPSSTSGPLAQTLRRPRPFPERDRRSLRQDHGRDPASPRLSIPIRRPFGVAHRRGLGRRPCRRHSVGEGRDAERHRDAARQPVASWTRSTAASRRTDKFVFLRGLMSTSIGTLIEIANSHRDLLSPYMTEMLDQVGTIGPRQAEEAEELLERYHRQVQQRVFGKGYRILLMPTMATPLVGADMFKSKEKQLDPVDRHRAGICPDVALEPPQPLSSRGRPARRGRKPNALGDAGGRPNLRRSRCLPVRVQLVSTSAGTLRRGAVPDLRVRLRGRRERLSRTERRRRVALHLPSQTR